MGRRKGRPPLTTVDGRATIAVKVETQRRLASLADRTGHSIIEIADRLINAALDAEDEADQRHWGHKR